MANIRILNSDTFEYQDYTEADELLIPTSELDTAFSASTDYIELTVFDQNRNKLFPEVTHEFGQYSIRGGDVLITPDRNLEELGYDEGIFISQYKFYRKRLSSNPTDHYYIDEISNDRTEIRLKSPFIDATAIIASTNFFIAHRETSPYYVDFLLNFGDNRTAIATNIRLDDDIANDPSVLIKLYEPLPAEFDIKTRLWVVEEISPTQVYEVDFPEIEVELNDFEFISGPNFCLEVSQEIGQSSNKVNYNDLMSTPMTSSMSKLTSLLEEKGINVNIDYTDFANFVKFSSAKKRLENFIYKVGIIESSSLEISSYPTGAAFSSSRAEHQTVIDTTIANLDPYEYWLYYENNPLAYPKTGSNLVSTGSDAYLAWYGSEDENNIFYGGIVTSASNYDFDNQEELTQTIPEYLLEDPDNAPYELFVDMVAQHYDNIWVYTKDLANRFNADNRLDYGISKDLVADAVRDFGLKLYSNNFSTQDLYLAFLGTTISGSDFPINNITGSANLPLTGSLQGFELIDNKIMSTATTGSIPMNDANARLYKRFYHNLPYLLKTKGTMTGLRALITTFGIPDTILDAREYGGKIREKNYRDNLKQVYSSYSHFTTASFVETPWNLNPEWSASAFPSESLTFTIDRGITQSVNISESGYFNIPSSIEFRFKPEGSVPSNTTSTLLSITSSLANPTLTLTYSGSTVTESHSGSVRDIYYNYGTLTFYPEGSSSAAPSASLNLPFYNGDWWGAMIDYAPSSSGVDVYESGSFTLTAANKSSNGQLSQQVGFKQTSSVKADASNILSGSVVRLGSNTFSGSVQELRYYIAPKLQDSFDDFVLNPYSYEGVGPTGSIDSLVFRLPLGNNLYQNSGSVHPKVAGTHVTQSSFINHSTASIVSSSFINYTEYIAQNTMPAGIRSQISDQIAVEGFTPSDLRNNVLLDDKGITNVDGINVKVDSNNQGNGSVLSQFQSLQQASHLSLRDNDTRYLEVAFSPSNEINDDIIAQMGYFNIGEYIGDVRDMYDVDSTSYPKLDVLRDAYFEKYLKSYDVTEFVRLIKYLDNSLFKMIKDFTPANVSLTSGVVVKQHLLERNRHRPVKTSIEDLQYTASIGNPLVHRFSGGAGGVMNEFQDSASYHNLTQSWDEIVQTIKGPVKVTHNDEAEFYNGELDGTKLDVISGTGAVDCSRFTNPTYRDVLVKPLFVTSADYTEEEFLLATTQPPEGAIWFWNDGSNVRHIKIHNTARNGVNLTSILPQLTSIPIFLNEPSTTPPPSLTTRPSGVYNWIIEELVIFDEYVYYRPAIAESPEIVYSQDINRVDFNLSATGDFIWYAIDNSRSPSLLNAYKASGDINSTPQGFFPVSSTYENEQFIRGWGDATYLTQSYDTFASFSGIVSDAGGNFDTGDSEISNGHSENFNVLAPQSREPWFMDVPQLTIVSGSASVHSGASERHITASAILLGSRIDDNVSPCSSPDIDTYAYTIAVNFDANEDLFTLTGGRYRVMMGANGTTRVKDMDLVNPANTNVSWESDSVINIGSADINLATGSYPVFRSSVINNDTVIVTIGLVSGSNARTINSVYFCPS